MNKVKSKNHGDHDVVSTVQSDSVKSKQKNPGHFNGRQRMFFVIACVLYVMSILNLVVVYSKTHNKSALPVAFQPYSLGAQITQGSVAMKFDDLRRTTEVIPGMPPLAEGFETIIVSFWVYNRTDKPIQILPSTDTYIKDSNGGVHFLTLKLENQFRAGELLPAEDIRGELSYLVPIGKPIKLYVDSIWSGGTIPIQL